jgi:hypothetical protein
MTEIRTFSSVNELTPEALADLSRRAHAERAVVLRAIGVRLRARVKSWLGLGRPTGSGPLAGANA